MPPLPDPVVAAEEANSNAILHTFEQLQERIRTQESERAELMRQQEALKAQADATRQELTRRKQMEVQHATDLLRELEGEKMRSMDLVRVKNQDGAGFKGDLDLLESQKQHLLREMLTAVRKGSESEEEVVLNHPYSGIKHLLQHLPQHLPQHLLQHLLQHLTVTLISSHSLTSILTLHTP